VRDTPHGEPGSGGERLNSMHRLLVALTVGSLAIFGCTSDDVSVGTDGSTTSTLPPVTGGGDPEQARLDAARARWEAAGIEDYAWTYARSCFCPQLTVTVQVKSGRAVDSQVVSDGQPAGTEADLKITTIPDLFDEVQAAIDTADSFTVDYERATGRVTSLDVDMIEGAADDEYGYAVTSFVPAGEVDSARDLAGLTEQWACGRGFHLSDPSQTIALMLDLSDPSSQQVPPQATALPDEAWDARVLVGANLFANWCDDVIETTDPVPRTDQIWPVVAGTITFTDDLSSLGSACERPVAARLTGLVVERPGGTRVPIADREVSNSCWNGAAG